nr:hypothetical protein [uncultured Acetatifactor sp.]
MDELAKGKALEKILRG